MLQECPLNKNTFELNIGQSETLIASVLPLDASDKSVIWESTNTSACTVDQSGLVLAVGNGQSNINVTTNDGSFKASAIASITTPVSSITLNTSSKTVDMGKTDQLIATIIPETASNKNVTWKSSNDSVATVDDNGLVSFILDGSVTITVTSVDGNHESFCDYTVVDPTVHVTDVTLDITTSTLYVGDTLQLTPTISPSDATNKNINWSSTDDTICTVSQSGLVTVLDVGVCDIIVTSVDGNKIATCSITSAIYIPVTSITATPSNPTIRVGEQVTATYTVLPSNATDKSRILYPASYEAIATLDVDGNKLTFTGVSASETSAVAVVEVGSKDRGDYKAVAIYVKVNA